MNSEEIKALKEVLEKIHRNSEWVFNRVKALELAVLHKHPDLWVDYRDELHYLLNAPLHRDFETWRDKIQ